MKKGEMIPDPLSPLPTPMSLAEASDAVAKIGRTFQGLLDVAKELERIGSISQAAAEADTLLAKKKSLLLQIEDEITASESERDQIKRITQNHSEAHAKLLADSETAKQELAKIVDVSNDRANKAVVLTATADAKLVELTTKAEKVKADAAIAKSEAAASVKEAKAELAGIAEQINTAKDELAHITGKIATFKEQAATMLNGFGPAL